MSGLGAYFSKPIFVLKPWSQTSHFKYHEPNDWKKYLGVLKIFMCCERCRINSKWLQIYQDLITFSKNIQDGSAKIICEYIDSLSHHMEPLRAFFFSKVPQISLKLVPRWDGENQCVCTPCESWPSERMTSPLMSRSEFTKENLCKIDISYFIKSKQKSKKDQFVIASKPSKPVVT